jgi:general secretion pathway protein H
VTLLELLIVLSIMAVVAAMVVPMFGGGVSTGELKGAARQVAAVLRLARSAALATRRETGVAASTTPDVESARPRAHAARRDRHRFFTAQSDLASDTVGAIRFFPMAGRTAAASRWRSASASTTSTWTGLPAASPFWTEMNGPDAHSVRCPRKEASLRPRRADRGRAHASS